MVQTNHYHTLKVNRQASQTEIKAAYRRLVKQFHPDSNREIGNHEQISSINAAYEILGDPQRRRSYDQQLRSGYSESELGQRQQRTAAAQSQYKRQRRSQQVAQVEVTVWIREVYTPVNRTLGSIVRSLGPEINLLSADPFDDELMEAFCEYIKQAQTSLSKAKAKFGSRPNPPQLARVAVNMYYCIDRLGDGIGELEWFTLNYDESYLHTGQEMFRIARSLLSEAQTAIKSFR